LSLSGQFNLIKFKINSVGDFIKFLDVQIDGDFEGWDGETIIKLTNVEI